jgi:ADP-ribosyl-[dinitrogen reductase] hydrolase
MWLYSDMNDGIKDRCLGSWLGLAIGDALGSPIQFQNRDTYEPIIGYRSGGVYQTPAGHWTDDTSMALCLAETLIEHQQYDPTDFGNRLVRWVEDGYNSSMPKCFDIGKTTLTAIGNFRRSGPDDCGETGEYSKGNGSIMRLAPVPIFHRGNPERAETASVWQGSFTHNNTVTANACYLLCHLLLEGYSSGSKDNVFDTLAELTFHADLEEITQQTYRTKLREDVLSDGYVVSTLEAALWAVWNTGTFEEAILLAVNLGHDADTVGAVTGQIAGAIYGYASIPAHLITGLYDAERLLDVGNRLVEGIVER